MTDNNVEKFGYFKTTDTQLHGIKYGNWGSRPYEYFWAACVEDYSGKDVFDFGTGVPSEHTWNEFVMSFGAKSYFGIDLDPRLKDEEINEPNRKMKCMNGTKLELPDNSFDLALSISSFEHIDDFSDFKKVMSEINRVLRPGGKMIVTLDEYHDCYRTDALPWNELEKAKKRLGIITHGRSYGICDFAQDIKEWFKPLGIPPVKQNAQQDILYSQVYNDCVSYGVFEVIK